VNLVSPIAGRRGERRGLGLAADESDVILDAHLVCASQVVEQLEIHGTGCRYGCASNNRFVMDCRAGGPAAVCEISVRGVMHFAGHYEIATKRLEQLTGKT